MGRFLKRKTDTVFIILGNSCNMNCAYCMQHLLVHKALPSDINPDIYDFFSELAEESGDKLHLVFYGGEPLIYFPTIKEIVAETKRREINLDYAIITNGKATNEEIAKFLNENNMCVTVSWDGYSTIRTRGYDVFANEKTRELLLGLDELCLSGVISALAYPLEILNAFQDISEAYYARHGRHVNVNLDEVFDTGLHNRQLLNVDYSRVKEEMLYMIRLYLDAADKSVDGNNHTKLHYIHNIIKQLNNFYNGDGWHRYTTVCRNGTCVLNIDLMGNLYPCHNTDTKIGNIYTPYYEYLENLLTADSAMPDRASCINCVALPYCKGGCKLVKDKSDYCRLKQAVAQPVLETLYKYSKEKKSHDC